MKIMRLMLYFTALSLFLILPEPGFSWQGRMAGAGDPSGLIEDESDFLIHPASLSTGKELNFYGTYRLSYDWTSQWNNKTGLPSEDMYYPFEAEGSEWKNEGIAGLVLPLGTGSMGFLIEYLGIRADYEGDENDYGSSGDHLSFHMNSKADNIALRSFYGMPVGGIRLGGELQFSHKAEENSEDNTPLRKNVFIITYINPAYDLYAYMIPFRSDYYESLGKLSAEGSIESVKNTFTLKGGMILPFASNNRYKSDNNGQEVEMRGEATGWTIGCDYWGRIPLNKDLLLPFVLGIEHKRIKREGSGDSNYSTSVDYEHMEKNTNARAGAGADYNLNMDTRIAIGLYYDYLQSNQDICIFDEYTTDILTYDYPNYPQKKENRITLKAMTEIKVYSGISLLGGLNAFYGKVKNRYYSEAFITAGDLTESDISTSGYNWGVNLSFGTAYKTGKASIEPFLNAGYYKLKIEGDGDYNVPVLSRYYSCKGESEKTDWIMSGGISVKY